MELNSKSWEVWVCLWGLCVWFWLVFFVGFFGFFLDLVYENSFETSSNY